MKRRQFVQSSFRVVTGAALSSLLENAWWGSIAQAAAPANGNDHTFVVVFLRGAMDGMSMTPPIQDPDYFAARTNVSVASTGEGAALKTANGFGLHPSMKNLQALSANGEALFIFGAGSPANTRSHFDAQDWMEAGTIATTNLPSGFLGRLSNQVNPPSLNSPSACIAVQPGLPRMLSGANPVMSFANLKSLHQKNSLTRDRALESKKNENEEAIDPAFYRLYGASKDPLFHGSAVTVVQDLPLIARAEEDLKSYDDRIPKGPLAKNLAQIAALIRTGAGVRLAATEMGGWDTHVNQGNGEKGRLSDHFQELDQALGFFWRALDHLKEKVTVLVMTEFGRTVHENGDRGTDHGHGSTFIVMSTGLAKRGVLHEFKGARKDLLYEGRDLEVNFDYREIVREILAGPLKIAAIPPNLFPGFTPQKKIGLF